MWPNESHNQVRSQEARAGAWLQRKACPGKMVWQCGRHVSGFRVLFLFPLRQKKTNEFCIFARGETIGTIIKSAALRTALHGYNYQWFAELGDNVGSLTWSKYYRQYCQGSRIMLTMFTVFISKVCMRGFVRRGARSVLSKLSLKRKLFFFKVQKSVLTGLWHINKETGCLQFELV